MLDVKEAVQYLQFGCYLRSMPRYEDDRGYLTPLFQDTDEKLVMSYMSTTYAGEARDANQWHIHRYQTDRFVCVDGDISFALSDGFATHVLRLQATPVMLYIPPNVYHCFRANSEAIIINFPTVDYDPEDEGRVLFSDIEAPRPW